MGLFANLKNKFFTTDGYGGGQSFLWNPLGGVWGRNKRELLFEYKNLVHSCVSVIAQDVARYEPCFYHENAKGEQTEILNHPFKLLLEAPNPYMSEYELFEQTQTLVELTGECFWYMTLKQTSRQPVQIDIMRPDLVQFSIDDTTGEILGYIYHRPDGTQIPLEVDEVIQFKTYNPLNKYRGLGTVEANLLYIDTENETASFQRNGMRNQASPSGVLTFKGNIGKDAFEKVKKVWKDQQTGTVNTGKTLFIRETDVSFEKIGLSVGDLDMSALKTITQDEVRGAFKIPKIMLGDADGAGLGRDVAETAEYIYQKRTIDPKLIRYDDTFRLYCRVAYKDNALFVGHESTIPQDQTQLLEQIKTLNLTVYTANESRALVGYPPIDGGDTLYAPFNFTPVDGLEPIPVAAKSYGTMKLITSTPKALDAPIEKTSQHTYIEQLNQIHRTTEKSYIGTMRLQLEAQKHETLTELRNSQHGLEKEVGPDQDSRVKAMLKAILPVLGMGMQHGGNTAVAFVDPGGEYVLDRKVKERIAKAEERLLKGFNKDTAAAISRQLEQGINAGETIEQLSARIESVYSDAQGYRATRIANSESNRAIVGATKDAYSQVGVSQVEWVTDGDPCPECEAMEGTIIDVDDSFIDIGESIPGGGRTNDYEDVEGGDLHPNCNCKLVPVGGDVSSGFKKQILRTEKIVEVDRGYKEKYEEQKQYSEQLELIAGIDGITEEA